MTSPIKPKTPAPTKCQGCGHVDATTVCRYCKRDKTRQFLRWGDAMEADERRHAETHRGVCNSWSGD